MKEVKIVVIEDDNMMISIYEAQLPLIFKKCKIISYRTREEFLGSLSTGHKIDVIISDVVLPDGNGYQLKKNLIDGGYSDIPILFVTSLGEIDEGGPDGFEVLGKPINSKKLSKILKKIMR